MRPSAFLLLTIALCSMALFNLSPSSSAVGEVEGIVTYNEKPIETAEIVFHNSKGHSAAGQILGGKIQNVITAGLAKKGVPVGSMKITIHPHIDLVQSLNERPVPNGRKPALRPFPTRYTQPEMSGLQAEIHIGMNELTLRLTD